jgi:hypothetical protein
MVQFRPLWTTGREHKCSGTLLSSKSFDYLHFFAHSSDGTAPLQLLSSETREVSGRLGLRIEGVQSINPQFRTVVG